MNGQLETYDRVTCDVAVAGLVVLHLPVYAQVWWLVTVALVAWLRPARRKAPARA